MRILGFIVLLFVYGCGKKKKDPPPIPIDAKVTCGIEKENGQPWLVCSDKSRTALLEGCTSEALEDPKSVEGSTVYELYQLVAPDKAPEMKQKLEAGGYGWGHAKQDLYEAIEAEIGPKREAYLEIRSDEEKLDGILEAGASQARPIADATIQRVRAAVGIE